MSPDPTHIPPGRIDIHSHILPGIDDGCTTVAESLESVRVLKAYGYVGTICTPHCWPNSYP
ncbi:MAG: CpsB/CapC family capsule biosynthesis tyrosine phosphatase, partial [Phycisphaeraceae bacterium]